MTSFRACLIVLGLLVAVAARPRDSAPLADLVAAASGHHHGRVQIKVYRGPDEHGHDHFAPHGYWVKQPADDDHH